MLRTDVDRLLRQLDQRYPLRTGHSKVDTWKEQHYISSSKSRQYDLRKIAVLSCQWGRLLCGTMGELTENIRRPICKESYAIAPHLGQAYELGAIYKKK